MDRPAGSGEEVRLNRLIAGQRRRHLVAQLMTAQRWARLLEDVLVRGVSPTGYGPPVTPLPADAAEEVLSPVRLAIARARQSVAEQAPDELEQSERPQPPRQTLMWARNLLERFADTIEALACELCAPNTDSELRGLLDKARSRLRSLGSE